MGYNISVRVEKTDEYAQWIDALRDQAARARVLVRVERLIGGNPGEHRNLTDGVSELKIDFGPGYRVYYSQREQGCCFSWPEATSRVSRRTSS